MLIEWLSCSKKQRTGLVAAATGQGITDDQRGASGKGAVCYEVIQSETLFDVGTERVLNFLFCSAPDLSAASSLFASFFNRY